MRLGIHDYYYDTDWELTPRQRYKIYKEAGFSCVDFNTSRTEMRFYTDPEEQMTRQMAEIRKELEGEGLSVHQIHGPWCWPPLKDETPEGRVLRAEEMKRSMRMAKLLGASNWVVHPIMPHRLRDLPEGNASSTWALNVEFMGWLLDYAKQVDVTICLENMPHRNFSMAKPEKVLQLVKELNDPHFQVCLDTGHVATQEGLVLEQQVRMLGKHLQVLHVHDNNGEKDQHQWPGKGILNWESFTQALKDIGFDGVFSLETGPADGVPEAQFRQEAKELAQIARDYII